jgi:transposase
VATPGSSPRLSRDVYAAGSDADARAALAELYATADAVEVPECRRLVRTVASWEDEVLAYYRCDGLSTARCEAVNALAEKIKRVGHGFRNLANYRLRLLLYCGGVTWHDPPAARLRRRTPQNAA